MAECSANRFDNLVFQLAALRSSILAHCFLWALMCVADISIAVILREGIFPVYAPTIISTVRAPKSLGPLAATCLLLMYIIYTSKQFEEVGEGDSGFCILVKFCHYCIVFYIAFINRQPQRSVQASDVTNSYF